MGTLNWQLYSSSPHTLSSIPGPEAHYCCHHSLWVGLWTKGDANVLSSCFPTEWVELLPAFARVFLHVWRLFIHRSSLLFTQVWEYQLWEVLPSPRSIIRGVRICFRLKQQAVSQIKTAWYCNPSSSPPPPSLCKHGNDGLSADGYEYLPASLFISRACSIFSSPLQLHCPPTARLIISLLMPTRVPCDSWLPAFFYPFFIFPVVASVFSLLIIIKPSFRSTDVFRFASVISVCRQGF